MHCTANDPPCTLSALCYIRSIYVTCNPSPYIGEIDKIVHGYLWKYKTKIPQKLSQVTCGSDNIKLPYVYVAANVQSQLMYTLAS